MGLYETLASSYPEENIAPWGLSLIIPANQMRDEWLKQLEEEGCRVYSQAYNGKACFFICKRSESQTQAREAKRGSEEPKKAESWTPEEEQTLIKLWHGEGLSIEEVAAKLGRSKGSILAKIGALKRRQKGKMEKAEGPPEASATPPSDLLAELLGALNALYPKHRRVCLFLLQNAKGLLGEGEGCEAERPP